MGTKIGQLFEYDEDEKILRAPKIGGQISFDEQTKNDEQTKKLHFNLGTQELESFQLTSEQKPFIKKRCLVRTEDTPSTNDREGLKAILLFQHFLRESSRILQIESFIPEPIARIVLCQCVIELLEEQRWHLYEYQETYFELLKLNFNLAEQHCELMEKAGASQKKILLDALKQWLNACRDQRNTNFDENFNREEEIYRAIFKFGEVKERFWDNEDKHFRDLLDELGIEWFLKSRYDFRHAFKILWKKREPVQDKAESDQLKTNWLWHFSFVLISLGLFVAAWKWRPNLIKWELGLIYCALLIAPILLWVVLRHFQWVHLAVPRLTVTIVIGYIPLILTQDVWRFSLQYYQADVPPYWWHYVAIISGSILVSFAYLLIEVSHRVKDPKLAVNRALSLFWLGALESFLIGLVLFHLFAQGMAKPTLDELEKINAKPTDLEGLFGGHIYPMPLILFASVALAIGIFVQAIWEDKPITEPL